MTPEEAHEMGKRVAREACCVASDETGVIRAGTPEALLSTLETKIEMEAGFICVNDTDRHMVAVALRGCAEFWREFAAEIEARAAALEATR